MLFIIILILSFISGLFLPWWVVAIVAFLAAVFLGKTNTRSFWSGFGGVAVAWIILALFKSIPNDNLLVKKVAQLFQLPHWILVLLITALIGGLAGGMSALSGILVKKAFRK
ncbi:MAG TPA: hypothetical protein VK668_06725 [Mucilaginibacter sp.]|nr:hypothetical protein [Mucilaginibacter sp.]